MVLLVQLKKLTCAEAADVGFWLTLIHFFVFLMKINSQAWADVRFSLYENFE